MRLNADLPQRIRTPEVLGVFGLSGRLQEPFGGHRGFALLVATLYGLLHVASVWTELAYSYDRFAILAWVVSPLVGLWVAGTVTAGLWLDVVALRRRWRGSPWSLLTLLLGLGVVTLGVYLVLPGTPTIAATFATRSAAGGYLKNELLYFLPVLLFVLPTFHAVIGLQAQLRQGNARSVLDFLAGKPEGIAPRGVWVVPLWFLVAVLLVAAAIGYHGVNNLLDHLVPGPYANLFAVVLHVRAVLWFVVALTCLIWYQRSLDELKREALAASRLMSR